MLNFTVWVVPFLALFIVTTNPELSIDFAVISRVQVDLIAVIAFFVVLEAFVAELAEADNLLSAGDRHLVEFGWFLA